MEEVSGNRPIGKDLSSSGKSSIKFNCSLHSTSLIEVQISKSPAFIGSTMS